jgi:serine protease
MRFQNFICTHTLILAILLLSTTEAFAAEISWHLVYKSTQHEVTIQPIFSSQLEPGPHETVVALIDAGVLPNHPSLQGKILSGYDMVSLPKNMRAGRSGNYTPDDLGSTCDGKPTSTLNRTHGTELASLIAGNGEHGVHGVNKNSKILPIKIFGSCPINRQDLMDALAWAAGFYVENAPANLRPARVINMSFSGGRVNCDADLQKLLDRIRQKGIFVVSAAGNRYGKSMLEPANCKGVISVGSIDFGNKISSYSAIDPRISIYASGGEIQTDSTKPTGLKKLRVATFQTNTLGYETPVAFEKGVGTSYSSALVSGFISLMLSWNPELMPDDFIFSIASFIRTMEAPLSCKECSPRGVTLNQISNK